VSFLGVEKKQTLLWRDEPGLLYCKAVCLWICTQNHERTGIGNLKILGFR